MLNLVSLRCARQHINGFSPATLQGQLPLSGKPPLNLARYIRELQA
ncbi:hypothetical protein KIF59_13775 [Enterobacter cloacae subsp. cloacae]|nr:hypothetical protein [Enterobacter cloacae subsp. cloacae]